MLVLAVPNHKIGQICFCACIIAFANAIIFMPTPLIIKQAKKLVLNQQRFLFAEKTLMATLKANMAYIDLSASHHLIQTNDVTPHSPASWSPPKYLILK